MDRHGIDPGRRGRAPSVLRLSVMPDWMLSGKGGFRECRGYGSDEEPCGLEDESIAEIENIDLVVQAEYLSNKRGAHGPSYAKVKKEIEQQRISWKAGDTNRCERDGLGVS